MKIAIVQGAFLPVPPLRGGAVEKIWYKLGKEFAELGHQVTHIGRSYPGLPAVEKQSRVEYIRVKGYDTPSSLIKLKWLDLLFSLRAVRKIPSDADVVVTNTFWSPLLLRGKQGKKVYVDVQRVPRGQMGFYKHVGMIRGCSPAICDAIKTEISPQFQQIISYVPNPVPFEIKSLNIKREKIILFVGRIHSEKGIHILLEAFALLGNPHFKDWKLVIIGPYEVKDGGEGEAYFNMLKKKSKNLNVDFKGPVYAEDELIINYARSSIFCYPAQEGSGDAAPVAPREAMAYGCVPVVSELPCFNDFIINEVNGLSFNQASSNQASELAMKLATLMQDQASLAKLSEEGKQIGVKYSTKEIAKKFINDFLIVHTAKVDI